MGDRYTLQSAQDSQFEKRVWTRISAEILSRATFVFAVRLVYCILQCQVYELSRLLNAGPV